ncbi:coiled-coil domain-containing protein 160 homolog [Arapaima gigas]
MGVEEGLDSGTQEEANWVAELFPPHFTMFDLLEESGNWANSGVRLPRPGFSLLLPAEKATKVQSSRKQEIYRSTLEEVQRTENRRRKQLVERIVRKQDESQEVSSAGTVDGGAAFKRSPGREEEVCIWNEQDLACLRWAVRKVAHDQRGLTARLQQALAEVERWRQQCRRLERLLDERDAQAVQGKCEAAMKNQQLEILQAQRRMNEARAKAWAADAQDRVQEARGESEKLRKVEEQVRELRVTNASLAQKVDMLRRQVEAERHQKMVVPFAEHEAVVQRLRDEVERARAELEAERQKHARSRVALELLHRHYISQPDRKQMDRIRYMYSAADFGP